MNRHLFSSIVSFESKIDIRLGDPLYFTLLSSSFTKLTTTKETKMQTIPPIYSYDKLAPSFGQTRYSRIRLVGITKAVNPTVDSIAPN